MDNLNEVLDTIICGNNVTVMSGWPDECIDLTITSPPYDLVDYDHEGNLVTHFDKGLRDYNGYSWDFTAVAQQLYRVTKLGGVVVWVVGDQTINGSETGSSFRQALYFMGLGFNVETMIYDTGQQGAKGSHDFYWQQFEFMFVFTKGKPITVKRIRDHVNIYGGTRNTSTRRQRDGSRAKERFVTPATSVRGNVWYYPTGFGVSSPDKIAFEHPAPFPEKLAHDHIISWSNPGMLVLDPFMGSGTVAKVCIQTDRHYLGIDVSPEYVALAQKRVAAVKAQPKLFTWGLEPAVGSD